MPLEHEESQLPLSTDTTYKPVVTMQPSNVQDVNNKQPQNLTLQQQRYNTLAIISLVAILFFPPLGIVLGIISLVQIKKSGEKGAVLAWISIILNGVVAVTALLLLFTTGLLIHGLG